MPFGTLRVPTVLSQTSDIGPNPLILGSGSTGLWESDDRVRSGLVNPVIQLGPEGTSRMQTKSFGPDPGDRPDARGPVIRGKLTTHRAWRGVRVGGGPVAGGGSAE